MSDFQRCPECEDWAFLTGHKCKPQWECRGAWEDWPNADWMIVHAYDAEEAAEKFCDKYDSEGGEYAIISSRVRGDTIIYVRKPVDDDLSFDVPNCELFAIQAEAIPTYYGTKIERHAS